MSPRMITALSGFALITSGVFIAVVGLPHPVSAGLLSLGLFGLHYRQAATAGFLSLTGSGVVFLGFVLLANQPVMEAILAGWSRSAMGLASVLIPVFIMVNGVVLFGVSLVRGRVFPWRNGIFMMLSALLLLITGSVGAILFAISLAWLGYQQLTGKDITGVQLNDNG